MVDTLSHERRLVQKGVVVSLFAPASPAGVYLAESTCDGVVAMIMAAKVGS